MGRKYDQPRWIYVDVDGTLSAGVIKWVRSSKKQGWTVVLWSSRGQAHALAAATNMHCQELFDYILAKPGLIVDDQGWNWVKFTKVARTCDQLRTTETNAGEMSTGKNMASMGQPDG